MFHMLGKSVRHKDSFLYGSKNLIGKNGIIMNADCHLDRGFEYLEKKITQKNNVFLHKIWTISKPWCVHSSRYLWPRYPYQGFHDAWVFRFAYTTCCTIYVVFHSRGFCDVPRVLIADASHFHCIVLAPTKLKPAAPFVGTTFEVKLTLCHG